MAWAAPGRRKQRNGSPGASRPRRKQRNDSPGASPPRRKQRSDSPDASPPRRRERNGSPDASPPRRQGGSDTARKEAEEKPAHGLTTAAQLKAQIEKKKKDELAKLRWPLDEWTIVPNPELHTTSGMHSPACSAREPKQCIGIGEVRSQLSRAVPESIMHIEFN